MTWINRVSQLFQPAKIIPKEALSKTNVALKNHKLLMDAGIISSTDSGMFYFLPLGNRVVEKLEKLVDEEMKLIGAQKIRVPALTSASLWEKTARLEEAKSELLMLKDRHGKGYILGPTFEEAITNLIFHNSPLKRKDLPLRLYQISPKWRDEMKPRLGLLRSREFIMKDLYTFDVNAENSKITYDTVNQAYQNIFKSIEIPFVKVAADAGIIGGSLSHEYHYLSTIGEDQIKFCKSCQYYHDNATEPTDVCPKCSGNFEQINSVEVGHTFLLGTKYSKPLKATYNDNNNKQQHLHMGCYGLGITRIIATAVEILSSDLEIRWPLKLAPYTVCILPPKKGSKQETMAQLSYDLYMSLQNLNIDVIMDDRTDMSIGKRFIDVRKFGYPFAIVVGKSSLDTVPTVEVHDVYNASHVNLTQENVVEHLKNLLRKDK